MPRLAYVVLWIVSSPVQFRSRRHCLSGAPIRDLSKTRLPSPLRPEGCAAISACFIRDLSVTIDALARTDRDFAGYAVYMPIGPEARCGGLATRLLGEAAYSEDQ
jgi:hypothetical protein